MASIDGECATTGATHPGATQPAIALELPGLPQSVHLPLPEKAMPGVISTILRLMVLAWTADKPIPAVTKTASNKTIICRTNKRDMAIYYLAAMYGKIKP